MLASLGLLSFAAAASDTTGYLTQEAGTAGCIHHNGIDGACVEGTALNGAGSVTVSPDRESAYVASEGRFGTSGAVAVFDRGDIADGTATAKKTQQQKSTKIVVKVKVKAYEDLEAKAKRKSYKLPPQTKSISEGKKKTLKLKPKKSKDARKVAKSLKKGKKAKAKLTVKLTDELGNAKSEKLSVKLKR